MSKVADYFGPMLGRRRSCWADVGPLAAMFSRLLGSFHDGSLWWYCILLYVNLCIVYSYFHVCFICSLTIILCVIKTVQPTPLLVIEPGCYSKIERDFNVFVSDNTCCLNYVVYDWHTKGETKWPPFCRRRFQIKFLVWKALYFHTNVSVICSNAVNLQYDRQHWFRRWPVAEQATDRYLNRWWLFYWHTFTSLDTDELNPLKTDKTLYYSDVVMSAMASQIIRIAIVCSAVCSGANQRKYHSSASLFFVRWTHRWPVNSPHKS